MAYPPGQVFDQRRLAKISDIHYIIHITGWWFGTSEDGFYFSICWECHHPN
jgi:hypothetical protein